MVLQEHIADLTRLIGFRLATFTLQVDFLLNPGFAKDVMASSNSHFKTQVQEQVAKVAKPDGSIRCPAQHSLQRLACSHGNILPQDDTKE